MQNSQQANENQKKAKKREGKKKKQQREEETHRGDSCNRVANKAPKHEREKGMWLKNLP